VEDVSGPLIFVATNKLRPGKFEAEQERLPGFIRHIEENDPRLIAFNQYINADRSEASVVQVHPGTTRIQLFGQASDAILTALAAYTADDVEVTMSPLHMAGFTRAHTAE
jgi:hypothetical protein